MRYNSFRDWKTFSVHPPVNGYLIEWIGGRSGGESRGDGHHHSYAEPKIQWISNNHCPYGQQATGPLPTFYLLRYVEKISLRICWYSLNVMHSTNVTPNKGLVQSVTRLLWPDICDPTLIWLKSCTTAKKNVRIPDRCLCRVVYFHTRTASLCLSPTQV